MPFDWSHFLINTVTFQTVTTGPDSSSDSGKRTLSTGTVYAPPTGASVQAADPGEVVIHGGVESLVTHRIYFGSEPYDTSEGARVEGKPTDRRCRVDDLFLWAKDPSDPSRIDTFYALGEAVNVAGRGVAWVVNCVLRT